MENETDLKNALIKRAKGYEISETVEEFQIDENGESKPIKRKITTKYVPPDISSIKLLLIHFYKADETELSKMTDEELQEEKKRLISLLEDSED